MPSSWYCCCTEFSVFDLGVVVPFSFFSFLLGGVRERGAGYLACSMRAVLLSSGPLILTWGTIVFCCDGKVWELSTGACKHTLAGHTQTVRCVSLVNGYIVSGSRDNKVRVCPALPSQAAPIGSHSFISFNNVSNILRYL